MEFRSSQKSFLFCGMKYKCVIFDCDGVLVDSEAISARVFQEMLSDLGYCFDFQEIVEQITGTAMNENLRFFEEKMGAVLPESFVGEFRKRSFQAYQKELKPIPGVHSLISKIKIPKGVASSGPVKKIKMNLQITHLIHYFGNNIFSSYEIGSWKPDPQIYLHAAKNMGFQPHECVIVEDSIVGVKAAINGGFDVFAYTTKNKKETFEDLGAQVIFEMNELEKVLVTV